ncbi:hypothetical protein FDP41_002211 [Naegleria fowleri]|uniref:SH3b domain-containing protein n=1 Tax=Naegleria fowleri TaxID=5763 RepID=A0A6A5BXB1_NAEFO|nr:uncharacterized protein FDP41_002211 [Naegleria fowleri]KAF0979141.1 hypothetical protein FDP41_002211 [Naegleria fowleri]
MSKLFLCSVLLVFFAACCVLAADSESLLSNGATLVVNTDSLNVRSGPCTNQGVITSLSLGTSVTYIGETASGCGYSWHKIRGSFGVGYAASQYLNEQSNNGGSSGASITVDQLKACMPGLSASKANIYINYLNDALRTGNINTCCRKSAFLAQLAHESGDLNWWVEFASGAAYEGRKDLGNIYPGDGVRYKGRGPIQITGRANYRAAGQAIGVDLENNPTRAADTDVGFRTAVWFWNSRSLNQYADHCDQANFDIITRRINGGYNVALLAQSLNIRSGPCTNKRVLASLTQGKQVTYTGKTVRGCGYLWHSVRGAFGLGYAATQFLSEKRSSKPSPSKPSGPSSPKPTAGGLTAAQLMRCMPNLRTSKAVTYIPYLNAAMKSGNINTCCRRSAFLAQLAHESGDLNWWVEFASGREYEGRRDLGNIYPGDGVRYKGRGPIQITGRANYRAAGRALGIDLEGHPTRASDVDVGFRTAVWFWNTRSLNTYADRCNQANFDIITRRINGGYNGKAERDAKWRHIRSVLGC